MKRKAEEIESTAAVHEVKIRNGLRNDLIKIGEKDLPDVPDHLFTLHTTCAFVGNTNSGKTNAAVVLAREYLDHGSINRVFIISPTADQNRYFEVLKCNSEDIYKAKKALNHSQECLTEVLEKIKDSAEEYFEYLEYCEAYKNWKKGKANYFEMLMLRNNQYELPEFVPKPSCLIIFDDLSHTKMYSMARDNEFINLMLRHRHIFDVGVTLFMLVQNFKTGIPKILRQNIRQYFLWSTRDRTQLKAIYEEIANICEPEDFLKVYKQATEGDHDFLTVDLPNPDRKLKFRKNFDSYLVVE